MCAHRAKANFIYMTNQQALPLFTHKLSQYVAVKDNNYINAQTFLNHVVYLAGQLPNKTYVINLAEDRYQFMVGFAAALINGQTTLLPPSHAPKTVQQIAQQYPDCFCLTDHEISDVRVPMHHIDLTGHQNNVELTVPRIPAAHLACIAFTSGSTGQPSANPKTWGRIVHVTKLIQQSFDIDNEEPVTIIATVPAQHMYGLETSILLPWVSNSCMYAARPFYPQDIYHALQSIPGPKVLITTPIHLRACVQAEIQWSPPEFIISATAPLTTILAKQSEQAFSAPVLEIYGCTEFGSMAKRRTTAGDEWQLFRGLSLERNRDAYSVHAPILEAPIKLSDKLEILSNNRFKLLGRLADMINIAGKRASLADLNQKLLAIPGVNDGIIFYPGDNSQSITRLTALIVAPNLSVAEINTALKQHFDAAFLPRPIYKVSELPREKTGKISRKNLLAALEQVKSAS